MRMLFVCIENSCRSQMAEALARMEGVEDAHSAGSAPSGVVNPKAIASMAELGYDLSVHDSKSLEEIPEGPYDFVATMGCGDRCPHLPATRREDWDIPDPKQMEPAEFAAVRDEIRRRVRAVLAEMS